MILLGRLKKYSYIHKSSPKTEVKKHLGDLDRNGTVTLKGNREIWTCPIEERCQ